MQPKRCKTFLTYKGNGKTASFRLSKKASQNFSRKRKTKYKRFSAAACTWTKTPIRLQVWNLFVNCEQILRAADCKNLAEKPEGIFRQTQASPNFGRGLFI